MADYSDSQLLAIAQPKTDWATKLRFPVYEEKGGLPQGWLSAVMQEESAGNPAAVSPKGAKGLFQLMDPTAAQYGVDPFDPQQAVEGATAEFQQLFKKYKGHVPSVIAAWNWGQGNLDQYGLEKAPQETRDLTQRVMNRLGSASAPAQPQQAAVLSDADLLEMGRGTASTQPVAPSPAPTVRPQAPPGMAVPGGTQPVGPSATPPPTHSLNPAMGLQGEALTPETPSGPRIPRSAFAMSGDLIEDISGVTPTRARMPSDMVLDIRKPSTPQPVPLPGMAVTPPGLPSPADTIPSAAQIVALPGQLKDLAITAAPYAISTIGGVGGAALGTFLGGPVGGLFGESIGSLGARKLNVALGLEEPGLTGDIIAGASPAAMRGVLGVGKRLFRNLPGTSPVAHEVAQEALEQVPGKLAPATAATDLWQEAAKHHPPVPMPEVDQTAAKIMREQLRMQPTSRQGELLKRAEDLQDLIRTHGGNVPLDLMDEHRKEYGIRIAEAAGSKDWRLEKGLKELYGAFHRDLDTAAARATPGAEGLQSAIQATRREKAVEDLALLWGPGRGIAPAVGGEHMQVNGRGILRQFEKMVAEDEVFAKSFAPGELKKIRETLKDVARMTTRPATNVSGLGSRVMPYVAHGTVLGGALKGNMPIMAIGMAMEAAPYAIAEAIQTPLGRAAIRRAFQEGGGHLTAAGIALINESLREQPEGTVRATIRQGEGQAPAAPPRLSLPGMGGQ